MSDESLNNENDNNGQINDLRKKVHDCLEDLKERIEEHLTALIENKKIGSLTKITLASGIHLEDLTFDSIQNPVEEAYLEDYPDPEVSDDIIKARLLNLVLYRINLYYVIWRYIGYAKKLVESRSKLLSKRGVVATDIIIDAYYKLWRMRATIHKSGLEYRNLSYDILLGLAVRTIYTIFIDYIRRPDLTNLEDPDTLEHSNSNPDKKKVQLLIQFGKEMWETMKSIPYIDRRDAIILKYVLLPGKESKDYADRMHITANYFNQLIRRACEAVLPRIKSNSKFKEIEEALLSPEGTTSEDIENELDVMLTAIKLVFEKSFYTDFKKYYDQEPEVFKKYFEDKYGTFEDESKDNN